MSLGFLGMGLSVSRAFVAVTACSVGGDSGRGAEVTESMLDNEVCCFAFDCHALF